MAKEISINLIAELKNGTLYSRVAGSQNSDLKFDQSTAGKQEGTLTVGTSGVSVPVDLLTNPGIATLQNLSADTEVLVGNFESSTFREFAKLRPLGGLAVFEMTTATIRLKTSSGSAVVQFTVWDA